MEYTGKIQNGVVVLEQGCALAEGVRVRVLPIEREHEDTTLGQRLLQFVGLADGLPSDMAENHDHYIHGTPKR